MFAYCLNNPVNLVDITGTVGGLAALKVLGKAGLSGLCIPGGKLLAVAAVIIIVVVVIVEVAEAQPAKKLPPKKEKDNKPLPISTPKKQSEKEEKNGTLIYRWARNRNTDAREYKNLTPRSVDSDGLSFSTIPDPTRGNAVTTIEALTAAGFICEIKGTHVSVRPGPGMPSLADWQASRDNANNDPHELTLLLYDLTW